MRYRASFDSIMLPSEIIGGASSAWYILRLSLFLIAIHCSATCRFVGLVNRHAPMSSSPTRCINKEARPSPDLRRHLEAYLGCPVDHGASRGLGKAVSAEMAWLGGEGMLASFARVASRYSVHRRDSRMPLQAT